jgi:hypothetical protein
MAQAEGGSCSATQGSTALDSTAHSRARRQQDVSELGMSAMLHAVALSRLSCKIASAEHSTAQTMSPKGVCFGPNVECA